MPTWKASFGGKCVPLCSGGSRRGARGAAPPSFLDQTEQNFLETAPSAPPSPPPSRLSLSLDPALPLCAMYTEQIYRKHVISFSNKFRINKQVRICTTKHDIHGGHPKPVFPLLPVIFEFQPREKAEILVTKQYISSAEFA